MSLRGRSITRLVLLIAVSLMAIGEVSRIVAPSVALACAPARPTDGSRSGLERIDQRPCRVQPDCTCI